MDAPVLMLSSDERALIKALRNGRRHHRQRRLRADCWATLPAQCSPKTAPAGGEAANRRRQQTLPPIERFRDFDQIALVAKREFLERVDAEVKDKIDQSANDPHASASSRWTVSSLRRSFPVRAITPASAAGKVPRLRHHLLQTFGPGRT